jgi:hypothetical protein
MANSANSTPAAAPDVTWHGRYSIEDREAMIREAAYYRFLKRGGAHGQDVQDWLAAESELDSSAAGVPGIELQPLNIQQSSLHGMAEDDELKRMIRQHPHRAIPQIEGIEPRDAPGREL